MKQQQQQQQQRDGVPALFSSGLPCRTAKFYNPPRWEVQINLQGEIIRDRPAGTWESHSHHMQQLLPIYRIALLSDAPQPAE